ncbi:MAG TPA: outer membrane beta-barrel protein [Candidatus Krumholzibacteria bacterium]|nr:outer membrane beta-barrel protein [Candidatus Krumholzibacteria bacterium]
MSARAAWILALASSALFASSAVSASEPDSLSTPAPQMPETTAVAPEPARADASEPSDGLIYLVPSMKDAGFRVTNDRERFQHRIWFSPGYGQLGSQDLFAFRVGYSPNTWLGYEVSLGHNPASSLHGLLHTFNVVVRYPLSGRFQPYATLGYGMMTVYPGQAINADPVTKNALTAGGGLEIYIRNDVAIRGEMRGATVLGQQLNVEGTVAYDYLEYTIGFAFFRSLGS